MCLLFWKNRNTKKDNGPIEISSSGRKDMFLTGETGHATFSDHKYPQVQRYHISENKDEMNDNFKKWRVRKDNSLKTIRFFDTQRQAIVYAQGLANRNDTTIVIHKVDGSIRTQNYNKK
ncbi:MAG: DUF2188 domain-containing protein [Acholeplasmataceae bacterium]